MNLDEAAAFARDWLGAWTGNDPERLLGFYAEEALYRDPARPKGLHGQAALRDYFTKLLEANPKWVWQAEEVMPTAKGFTLKWRATIPVGDRSIQETGLDIVEVENSRITRNEVYFDRTPLFQAMKRG
jgi:SnoaL-like protein